MSASPSTATKPAGKLIKINFEVPGATEKRSLVLKNRVVNSRATWVSAPDVTLTGATADLNAVLLSGDPETAKQMLASGKITATGNSQALLELLGMMTVFDFWFPIVTPAVPGPQPSACKVTP